MDLLEYANQRLNDLTLHAASFPGLTPTLIQLRAQITSYQNALNNWTWGNKASTIAKHKEREKLELILTQMAYDCAVIANNDQGVFALSGFGLKMKGVRHDVLDTPQNFRFTDGPMPGTLRASFDGVPFKHAYEVKVSKTPDDPASWTTMVSDSASPVVIGELESGVRYYGYVRAIGSRGVLSDASNMDSRITQ